MPRCHLRFNWCFYRLVIFISHYNITYYDDNRLLSQHKSTKMDKIIDQIYSPYLIKHYPACFLLKSYFHSGGIAVGLCSHWRDNDCLDISIHFFRRDYQAMPCLLDFESDCWIKINEVDIVLVYFHSQLSIGMSIVSSSDNSSSFRCCLLCGTFRFRW